MRALWITAAIVACVSAGGCQATKSSEQTPSQRTSSDMHQSVAAPSHTDSVPPLSAPAPATFTVFASASPAPSWANTFRNVSSGIVRLDVANCSGGATGTGFLVAPTLVATVAHVVEGMDVIRVTVPALGIATSGTVVGESHDHDLALIQTATAIPGHIFDLALSQPEIGTEIAAVGFPLGRAMQLSPGHITGTHDHRPVGGDNFSVVLSDVVLTDAALNPGNSGGPWITKAGRVVALDESGPPYAGEERAQGNNGGVSSSDAAALFAKWEQAPASTSAGDYSPATPVEAAEWTLFYYFVDINAADYDSAYAQLNPLKYPVSGKGQFLLGVSTSSDSAIDTAGAAYDVSGSGQRDDAHPYVDAYFQSTQDADHGPDGETCTLWTLRYTFSNVNGLDLSTQAPRHPGLRATCRATTRPQQTRAQVRSLFGSIRRHRLASNVVS